jgi:hypothetical protein
MGEAAQSSKLIAERNDWTESEKLNSSADTWREELITGN